MGTNFNKTFAAGCHRDGSLQRRSIADHAGPSNCTHFRHRDPSRSQSDEALQGFCKSIKGIKGIKRTNDTGRPVRDLHLSKAQCWRAVSVQESARNDRSAFPQQAMTESEKRIVTMRKAGSPKTPERPVGHASGNPSCRAAPRFMCSVRRREKARRLRLRRATHRVF